MIRNGLLDHFVKDLHVFHKLRENAQTALRRFVKQDVRRRPITNGDHANFVGLYLEDAFNGAFERVLQRDDSVGLQA